MDKFEYYNQLLPFYSDLLTERQKEIMEMYFFEDLSLTEIAENLQISRNAVYDTIKKGENLLNEYENALKLNKNYKKRVELYQQLLDLKIEHVNQIVDELLKTEE